MNSIRRFTTGLVISLLLAACGGGSGTDADGAWQGALLTESDETGGATNLRFAMGAGGQAVASWSVFHGGMTDQIVNHHDPASGWAGAVAADRDIDSVSFPAMRLAVDGTGNAIGVWGQRDMLPSDTSSFIATTYDAGSSMWSGPVTLDMDDTGTADRVDVAVGPAGTFWVIFALNLGATMEVQVNRFTPGSGWSGPTLLDSAARDPAETGLLGAVHIAADEEGNAVAAWSRYTDTDADGTIEQGDDNESVFSARYDADTAAWSLPVQLNATDVNGAFARDVRVDPTGGFLVLWRQIDASFDVRAVGRFYRDGVLQSAVPLWDYSDGYFPTEAVMDSNGNAFVFGADAGVIVAARHEAGDGWQPVTVLEDDPAADAILDDFAMNDSGDAFVIWRADDAGERDVMVRRFDSGSWLPATNVDAPDSGDVGNEVRIVAGPDGNAMAAWHADDGSVSSVHANRFHAAAGWGDAIEIDAGAAPVISTLGLDVDADGAVMAAWVQGDPDDEDVYSNRFE